jgi:hypothetical protein
MRRTSRLDKNGRCDLLLTEAERCFVDYSAVQSSVWDVLCDILHPCCAIDTRVTISGSFFTSFGGVVDYYAVVGYMQNLPTSWSRYTCRTYGRHHDRDRTSISSQLQLQSQPQLQLQLRKDEETTSVTMTRTRELECIYICIYIHIPRYIYVSIYCILIKHKTSYGGCVGSYGLSLSPSLAAAHSVIASIPQNSITTLRPCFPLLSLSFRPRGSSLPFHGLALTPHGVRSDIGHVLYHSWDLLPRWNCSTEEEKGSMGRRPFHT